MRSLRIFGFLLGSTSLIACSEGSRVNEAASSDGGPGGGGVSSGGAPGGNTVASGATDAAGGASSGGASSGGGSSGGSSGSTTTAPDAGSIVVAGECGTDPSVIRSFCDPATWGGTAPTATTDIVIDGDVVLDCDAEVRSIEIPAGGTLIASRTKDSSLTLHGNLVVRGRLDYGTPEDRVCGVTAEIIFQGMDDESFQGTPSPPFTGTMPGVFPEPIDVPLEVIDSDYGVWVVDSGVFTGAGEAKRAWSKLTESAGPGDATFTVEDATGWLADDRIVLTPTAESSVSENYLQFDEAAIAGIEGQTVTLDAAPGYDHAGCTDCVRRGEAIDLSRNVVVRSFDDTAHAHMIVGNSGLLQLDSVELRWLGPHRSCATGEPQRRAPIYFHEQGDASADSFVRHVSIWGGKNHFYMQEKSNGVEVTDVAGYDTAGEGFAMFYDNSTCDTRCSGDNWVVTGTVFTDVLAAKVAVPERDDCNAIGSVIGINPSGGEGTGCQGCVATGVAYNFGAYGNEGAIHLAEGGSGRPVDFTLNNNVAHNNAGNGISNWQNAGELEPPYDGNQVWSNGADGVHHGAYTNPYEYTNLTAIDNVEADFAVIAIQSDETRARVDGAFFDGFRTLPYFLVPTLPVVIKNAVFSGARDPAITQVQDPCSGGDETDPNDGTCIRNWLHFDNPQIPAGVKPFFFGWHMNKNSLWEVRNFSHPDYPDLPANFDLYRRDNEVAGGSYNADFDAWLVPR